MSALEWVTEEVMESLTLSSTVPDTVAVPPGVLDPREAEMEGEAVTVLEARAEEDAVADAVDVLDPRTE